MNISVQDLGVLGRVSFLQSQPVLRYAIGVISKYVFNFIRKRRTALHSACAALPPCAVLWLLVHCQPFCFLSVESSAVVPGQNQVL